MNLEDVKLGERITAIFKGDNGTGKSIAASSFPKPFIFFFEERWRSLKNYWQRVNPDKLKEIEFEYVGDMSMYKIDELLKKVMSRPTYSTLVLDSITSGGDVILDKLKIRVKLDEEGNETNEADKGKGKRVGGIAVNIMEDFGAEDAQFREWRKKFFSFPGNIIWTAHVIEVSQPNMQTGSTNISRELMTGGRKLSKRLPVYFDEAYHFNVEDKKYTFHTKHGGHDWAKTSLPLDDKIDFTDGNAYELLMGNLKKNEDKLIELRTKAEEAKLRLRTLSK